MPPDYGLKDSSHRLYVFCIDFVLRGVDSKQQVKESVSVSLSLC